MSPNFLIQRGLSAILKKMTWLIPVFNRKYLGLGFDIFFVHVWYLALLSRVIVWQRKHERGKAMKYF